MINLTGTLAGIDINLNLEAATFWSSTWWEPTAIRQGKSGDVGCMINDWPRISRYYTTTEMLSVILSEIPKPTEEQLRLHNLRIVGSEPKKSYVGDVVWTLAYDLKTTEACMVRETSKQVLGKCRWHVEKIQLGLKAENLKTKFGIVGRDWQERDLDLRCSICGNRLGTHTIDHNANDALVCPLSPCPVEENALFQKFGLLTLLLSLTDLDIKCKECRRPLKEHYRKYTDAICPPSASCPEETKPKLYACVNASTCSYKNSCARRKPHKYQTGCYDPTNCTIQDKKGGLYCYCVPTDLLKEYRILNEGEIIAIGDEYYNKQHDYWLPSSLFGFKIGKEDKYRRPVK
jgi:hypothetical protein